MLGDEEGFVEEIRAAVFKNMMTFGRIYSAMIREEEHAATCMIANERINIWQSSGSIFLDRLSNGDQSEFMEINGLSLNDARRLVVTWVSRSLEFIKDKNK